MTRELLHFNGVDGDTGRYAITPMSVERFVASLQGRRPQPGLRGKGVAAGVDGSKPCQAGWGIVVPQGLDSSILEVLTELVKHRDNPHFRWFSYLPGDSVAAFLARYGAAPGPVVREKIPYYLLLVGSPEQIPFHFQASLDVQHAVGRLDFEDAGGLERYVRSLITAEGEVKRRRRGVFFGVRSPNDLPTERSSECLVRPLAERLAAHYPEWEIVHRAGEAASKEALYREFHSEARPALVFTAGHAVFFSPDQKELQKERQGALLMSDWPGPRQWSKAVPREQYFAAHDLTTEAQVHGLIAFHFACFSGGTPHRDSFSENGKPPIIASVPFVARLPQALLSHREGGALAVIAHVDRAWESSFLWRGVDPQVAVFESALRCILDGQPVGFAMEVFGQRYAELAVQCHIQRLEMDRRGEDRAAREHEAQVWTAVHDAQGYILLGDPAARLNLENERCAAQDSTHC